MLGMFGYIGAAIVLAAILTIVYALTRPISARGDLKTWRVMIGLTIFVAAVPYLWCEVLTKLYGRGMSTPIQEVMAELDIDGGLRYYRVITCYNNRARVVAVGQDNENWGGTEQPVVAINMRKENGEWQAESFNVVNSLNRNKDSYTFPPYW